MLEEIIQKQYYNKNISPSCFNDPEHKTVRKAFLCGESALTLTTIIHFHSSKVFVAACKIWLATISILLQLKNDESTTLLVNKVGLSPSF